MHAPNTAVQKTQRGERGSYLIFDINQWEVVQKADLEILYEDIEGQPRLPRPPKLQGGAGQQGGPQQGQGQPPGGAPQPQGQQVPQPGQPQAGTAVGRH